MEFVASLTHSLSTRTMVLQERRLLSLDWFLARKSTN